MAHNKLIIENAGKLENYELKNGDLVHWGEEVFILSSSHEPMKYILVHYTRGYSLYNHAKTAPEIKKAILDNKMKVYGGNEIKLIFGERKF